MKLKIYVILVGLLYIFKSHAFQETNQVCAFFASLDSAKSAQVSSDTKLICILSYETPGDAPLRWMIRLNDPPKPVQPWHVRSSDGAYWQDCGSDFYPEFLGATPQNSDCTNALQDAFRAHLFLKMRLRGMGNTYACKNQVHFDTAGFSNGGCDVDFNGIGRSKIKFAKEVASPCFLLASSVPQNDFWGRFVNLEIDADVDGIAAQFGRSDFADPSNNFEISVNVKNNSRFSSAQAVVINAFYSSPFNIIGNCGGSDTGLYAVQLNRCNMCTGFIAAGQCDAGLVLANYTNGNAFSVDVEVANTGIVQLDDTCAYNEILCGVIGNVTHGIDNHLGGPLRIRNVPISGDQSIFANSTANDSSWGGYGVTIDDTGQNLTGFYPGVVPSPNVWVLNKSAQPQWISFFGDSSPGTFRVSVRSWYDFSSEGITVSESSPCGFILNPGEQVMYSGEGNYSWNWLPL